MYEIVYKFLLETKMSTYETIRKIAK